MHVLSNLDQDAVLNASLHFGSKITLPKPGQRVIFLLKGSYGKQVITKAIKERTHLRSTLLPDNNSRPATFRIRGKRRYVSALHLPGLWKARFATFEAATEQRCCLWPLPPCCRSSLRSLRFRETRGGKWARACSLLAPAKEGKTGELPKAKELPRKERPTETTALADLSSTRPLFPAVLTSSSFSAHSLFYLCTVLVKPCDLISLLATAFFFNFLILSFDLHLSLYRGFFFIRILSYPKL